MLSQILKSGDVLKKRHKDDDERRQCPFSFKLQRRVYQSIVFSMILNMVSGKWVSNDKDDSGYIYIADQENFSVAASAMLILSTYAGFAYVVVGLKSAVDKTISMPMTAFLTLDLIFQIMTSSLVFNYAYMDKQQRIQCKHECKIHHESFIDKMYSIMVLLNLIGVIYGMSPVIKLLEPNSKRAKKSFEQAVKEIIQIYNREFAVINNDLPEDYTLCPIAFKYKKLIINNLKNNIVEPVIAEDGVVYDKENIELWIEFCKQHPQMQFKEKYMSPFQREFISEVMQSDLSYNNYKSNQDGWAICCVSYEDMKFPVSDLCGHSFELDQVIKWLSINATCPLNRGEVEIQDLRFNYTVRKIIEKEKSRGIKESESQCDEKIVAKRDASIAMTESGLKKEFEVGEGSAKGDGHRRDQIISSDSNLLSSIWKRTRYSQLPESYRPFDLSNHSGEDGRRDSVRL